jgi:hypothetical protein
MVFGDGRSHEPGPGRPDRDAGRQHRPVKDIVFACGCCESILAFIDRETRSWARIKFRDLFVDVEDAKTLSIRCRFCGAVNTIKREG